MKVDNVKNVIRSLESINPFAEYSYELALLGFMRIQEFPFLIQKIPAGQTICRTRTHETSALYGFITDISIPPFKAVTEFARCNRPFQTKFYGSETRPTSFLELVENWAVGKRDGDKVYVTIGKWITKMPLFSVIVTSPNIDNRKCNFDKSWGTILDEGISQKDSETKEAMTILYQFLFERFRKYAKNDPLTYLITTAYCNVALAQTIGQANSIIYPSIPAKEEGVNFAINSDFIQPANIELTMATCFEMTVSDNENQKFNFTETDSWTAKEIKADTNEIIW